MRRVAVRGSYTVEAALLLPCILMFLIALLYLGFYMHDKARIQSVIAEVQTRGRILIRCGSHMNTGIMDYEQYNKRGIFYFLNQDLNQEREEIEAYLKDKTSRGLFIARITNTDIKVSQSRIKIEITADMEFPFMDVQKLFVNGGMNVQLENTVDLQNQIEFIRVFDIFSEAASRSEAGNKALTKLQEILKGIR